MGDTYRLLRFGVFELNLDLEELRKNGTPLKLPPQPFKLLAMLASRSGQVVTRDEIQEALWGSDTFIDFEQGVNKCIKQIRAALGDNADNPLYLETIPRRGYRFLAPVRTKTIPAPLPQVKEASSSLLTNVSGQVRARLEAEGTVLPPDPKTTPPPPVPTAPVEAAPPESPPTIARPWFLWALLPIVLLLAVLAYWLLTHPI
jgi:DNA-binding winged helix-turn-helix (wHTH) protein